MDKKMTYTAVPRFAYNNSCMFFSVVFHVIHVVFLNIGISSSCNDL